MNETLVNNPLLWLAQFPKRQASSHKYDFGHAVIIGSEKMSGATRLAAESCARIGAGLTTVLAPEKTGLIYRCTLPAHIIVEDWNNALTHHLADKRRNAVLIGPGAGSARKSLWKNILDLFALERSLVIDADALNALSDNFLRKNRNAALPVLTPHEGEFNRLFPGLEGSREFKAREAALRTGCIVVLKGSETVISNPEGRVVKNGNAPPFLATAGTGDALAGMITGLLTQDMPAFEASCAAVWIHGACAERIGAGLVASDLSDQISSVIRQLIT